LTFLKAIFPAQQADSIQEREKFYGAKCPAPVHVCSGVKLVSSVTGMSRNIPGWARPGRLSSAGVRIALNRPPRLGCANLERLRGVSPSGLKARSGAFPRQPALPTALHVAWAVFALSSLYVGRSRLAEPPAPCSAGGVVFLRGSALSRECRASQARHEFDCFRRGYHGLADIILARLHGLPIDLSISVLGGENLLSRLYEWYKSAFRE